MAFWNKKPTKEFDPLDQLKQQTKSQYVWQDELLDVKKDIEGINLIINEQNRKMDAFAIVIEDLSERHTDAMEVKETLQTLLEQIGYAKVNR